MLHNSLRIKAITLLRGFDLLDSYKLLAAGSTKGKTYKLLSHSLWANTKCEINFSWRSGDNMHTLLLASIDFAQGNSIFSHDHILVLSREIVMSVDALEEG